MKAQSSLHMISHCYNLSVVFDIDASAKESNEDRANVQDRTLR